MNNNISLHDFRLLAASQPGSVNFFRRTFASNYEEFVEIFYDDLNDAIASLELNPQFHSDDNEDKLTDFLVNNLTHAYSVAQGATGGGNKDITVKGKEQGWMWIGEAKIFKSITNLDEGFLQLTTRYRHADSTKNAAGVIAYTFRSNAASHLATWQTALEGKVLSNFSSTPCTKKPGMAFFSTHTHEASGVPMTIKHIAVSLFFEPKDKSARGAKKYKKPQVSG